MAKTVNVLMSTYNGERYLHQQIESILRQDGVDVMLTVRDDGSTDKTFAILDEYQAQGLLTWYSGENLGPARSFLHLLQHAQPADFYAFADQDDVWKPEKLKVAVELLQPDADTPALYFSPTQPADCDLQLLPTNPISPCLTFGESLVYEFVSGCTMVFTSQLRKQLIAYTPDYLPMHDVWIYCVAQALGAKIVFDTEPHILYRQHGSNAIGATNSSSQLWKKRWERFFNSEQSRSRRASEILKGYQHKMPAESLSLLRDFLSGKRSLSARLRLLRDKRFRCGEKHTQRLFAFNLLTNKY